jgi:uncharacterized membrane protein YfcA
MDIIQQALSFDGLAWLILAVGLAGLVRGFSGFGTALVFMPIAASITSPIWAIIMMMMFDLFGPLALLPRAWRDGEPRDVSLLGLGALIGLPIGVYFLTRMDPIVFRWLVSCLSLTMLFLLASGWRYRNPLNAAMTTLVGLISGFLTGIAALPGPPVILSYMSSPRSAAVIRGNTMLYLFLIDIMAFALFFIKGLLVMLPLIIGLILAVPYTIAGLVGQRIFDPNKDYIYRRVAYGLIAASALVGLPIWS